MLIAVEAASVNQIDVRIQQGEFRGILPIDLPQPMGLDVAGKVLSTGSAVAAFSPGEDVFARVGQDRMGTFAERAVVAQDDLAHRPSTIDAAEAASLPLVALAAWQALVDRGQVQPGHKVLVHGGSGGVGTIAIQLAKHFGAHVVTTASRENADFVRELGADEVIDYRSQDFVEELADLDPVLDGLGSKNVQRSLRVLRPGGAVIGITGPADPAFARKQGFGPVLSLGTRVLSAKVRRQARKLGVRYEFLFMDPSGEQLRTLAELVDSGALRPIVGRAVPFDDTPRALEILSERGIRGKVVITGAGGGEDRGPAAAGAPASPAVMPPRFQHADLPGSTADTSPPSRQPGQNVPMETVLAVLRQLFTPEGGWDIAVVVRVVVGTVSVFAFVVLLARIAGTRTFASFTTYDFLTNVAAGSLVATAITSGRLVEPCLGLLVLVVAQWVVSRSSALSAKAQAVVDNAPVVLVAKGERCHEAMRSARVSETLLQQSLRQAGVDEVGAVECAVLESGGTISVRKR